MTKIHPYRLTLKRHAPPAHKVQVPAALGCVEDARQPPGSLRCPLAVGHWLTSRGGIVSRMVRYREDESSLGNPSYQLQVEAEALCTAERCGYWGTGRTEVIAELPTERTAIHRQTWTPEEYQQGLVCDKG